MSLKEAFPFDEPRQSQIDAIAFAINSFLKSDKRFCIVEAGTGVGKSAVGLTIGRVLNIKYSPETDQDPLKGTYFVTTQKILQEQYVKDFGLPRGRMMSIKSSSNYKCRYHRGNSCGESKQLLRTAERSSRFFKTCTMNCVYNQAKEAFLNSPESVVNFPYLLTEATYSGKIKPRNLLVLDEAHNIESELSRFIEVSVSEWFSKKTLKAGWTKADTQFQAHKWISEVYYNKVHDRLKHIERMMSKYGGLKDKLDEMMGFARQLDMLRSHVDRLRMFLKHYDKENWIVEFEDFKGKGKRRITFKPVDVSKFAQDYLFRLGNKVLMMSATILDREAFCQSLGIPADEVAFLSLPSPFPVENRPIVELPVGPMNAKEIDNTLPKMAKVVKELLDTHSDDKGIIHCHTFKIAKYLWQYVESDRLLIHDTHDRDEVLQKHMQSDKPTVLLSPSMSEGVDLRDDCSRFQIICKIPYPYLGDKVVKKRMTKWPGWYPLQTAKSIVQAVGRSIRSVDDHAVTYILDAQWRSFYGRYKKFFPADFHNCIKR